MANNKNYPIIKATKAIIREQFFDDANVEANGGVITGNPVIAGGTATFDGTDSIEYTPDGLSKISGGKARAFRAWINFTGTGGTLSNLTKGGGTQEYAVLAVTIGVSNYMFSDGVNALNNVTWPTDTFPNDGKDHRFVFSLDDSDNYEAFLDGISIKTGTFAIPINTVDVQSIVIGKRTTGGGDLYIGSLKKEFGWFEGAWTAQEALDDYNNATFRYMNTWTHYLPFADPNPLLDKSGKGNHAFSNTATKLTDRNGYAFNSSNMRIPNGGISGNAGFTIVAWLKPSAITAMSPFCFGDSGVALAAAGLFTGVAGSGELSIEFAGGNTYRSATNQFYAGEEFCFTVTKAPGAIDTTTKMYKNGIDIPAVTASTNTPNIADVDAYIGSFAGVNRFIGDEYSIFLTDTAYTPTQIRDICKKGSKYFGI